MSANEQLIAKFLEEARERLEEIEEVLLELEGNPSDNEAINRLFRAFHTIKGSGAMFGFDQLADFTHHVETLLNQIRDGIVQIDGDTISLFLESRDLITCMLEQTVDEARVEALSSKVKKCMHGQAENSSAPEGQSEDNSAPQMKSWLIQFKPDVDLFAAGMNPICLLDELREMGDCRVQCITDHVPALDDLDPEQCHLKWEIRLKTEASEQDIRDVFIFVETGADLSVELDPQEETVAGDEESSAGTTVEAERDADGASALARKRPSSDQTTIKVTSDRLDKLVNLVGELVINRARLGQISAKYDDPDLDNVAESMERLVDDLRDSVLGIRMTPIGSTFTRFRRLVRDLSNELGKEVEFVTEGGETELDKTVLDKLTDPLLHLLRNSLDHGIESAETRQAAGKPESGTIKLTATHEGGSVQIVLHDDGKGLHRDTILKKAIERGIASPNADPTDQEVFSYIFAPGFSTAATVSSVSGRGVGMDVVKRTLESLRGSISIQSEYGKGTTCTLTLPMTLAIIEGLLVEVDASTYILPMASVRENVELSVADKANTKVRGTVEVRGDLIPFTRLRSVFNVSGEPPSYETVVITHSDNGRIGFAVDRVLGNHQTVIQPLGKFYHDLQIASGSTILGDGRVALILDPNGVERYAYQKFEHIDN